MHAYSFQTQTRRELSLHEEDIYLSGAFIQALSLGSYM
jgi:hypothetical protein